MAGITASKLQAGCSLRAPAEAPAARRTLRCRAAAATLATALSLASPPAAAAAAAALSTPQTVAADIAAPAQLPANWLRGMNLTSFQPDSYGDGRGQSSLNALAATGTSSVALTPTWYMDAATSTSIAPDPSLTPTDGAVLTAAATARSHRLSVVIKPHVDVRDGTFRGDIRPSSRAAWFASYRNELLHYADLASRAGATTLVVGTELQSTTSSTASWRRLIAVARQHFAGRLTYAANQLGEAQRIRFWDALELIGVDAYMPLAASSSQPSLDALIADWQPYIQQLASLSGAFDRHVLFTELGYQSVAGSNASPNQASAPTSFGEQALLYEAALRAWAPEHAWFDGIYWWDWEVDAGGHASPPGSFSPEGHPAAAVLSRFDGPALQDGGPQVGVIVGLAAVLAMLLGLATGALRRRPPVPALAPHGAWTAAAAALPRVPAQRLPDAAYGASSVLRRAPRAPIAPCVALPAAALRAHSTVVADARSAEVDWWLGELADGVEHPRPRPAAEPALRAGRSGARPSALRRPRRGGPLDLPVTRVSDQGIRAYAAVRKRPSAAPLS